MTFVQPPFWSEQFGRAWPQHPISARVTPSVAIVSSSVAAASVLAFNEPHGLVSGDTFAVAAHAGSTPALNGSYLATVIDPLHVSIPVTVTIAGAGGTATRTIAIEPMTLAQGKLRSGLDWAAGDPRDDLMLGYLAAARTKVETDTGLALLTQYRDVYFDAPPWNRTLNLPATQCRPLQAVVSFKSTNTSDVVDTFPASSYVVDYASGRIGLALSSLWPTDLRPFQPIVIRIVAGYASIAEIPAPLFHAIGILTAHYATIGRDVTQVGHIIAETPYGYADAIEPYQLMTLP